MRKNLQSVWLNMAVVKKAFYLTCGRHNLNLAIAPFKFMTVPRTFKVLFIFIHLTLLIGNQNKHEEGGYFGG